MGIHGRATRYAYPPPLRHGMVLSLVDRVRHGPHGRALALPRRYALPVIVPILILAAMGTQRPRLLWAAPVMALFTSVCFVGTQDYLSYNAALFSALQQLRGLGAADSEINGGYVING